MFSVEMRKIFTQTNLIQTASLFKLLGCFLFDFWVKVVGIRAEGVRIASMLRQQFKNLKPTTVPCWQDNWTLKIIRKYLHASERRLDEQWANKTFLVMHTTSQCRGHAHRSNYSFCIFVLNQSCGRSLQSPFYWEVLFTIWKDTSSHNTIQSTHLIIYICLILKLFWGKARTLKLESFQVCDGEVQCLFLCRSVRL